MIDLLKPIHDMPLTELTPPFVAALRDQMAVKHGRRQANYVLSVMSVACDFGRERGLVSENPIKGIRRIRRPRNAPQANRPWSEDERRAVLDNVPAQLRLPVALGMFTALRKTDVLKLKKSALRDGKIWLTTGKTGSDVSLPLHPTLARMISDNPVHDAETLTVSTKGESWTTDGFDTSFHRAIRKLQLAGKVEPGLTFQGLRSTVATLLIENGVDIDTVRRWLTHASLSMTIHYSKTANASKLLRAAVNKLDPLGSKRRTKVSNSGKKLSNRK